MRQLSPALKAFYDATVALGVASQVTTFTLSDFGRTFQPASGAGTDHAWGNHQFIIGDAVKGGDMFGQYPTLALGGPNDAGAARPLDSDDVRRPVRRDAREVVRRQRWPTLRPCFPISRKFATSDMGFMA